MNTPNDLLGNVRNQSHMEVDLSQLPEKTIDKSILKKMMGRKPYIEVEFSIEAVIGPAEVSFQCREWFLVLEGLGL